MVKVFGIPNCDTVKKALDWLKEHDIAYEFHDYKKQGITKTRLKDWSTKLGWEKLLNKKGTTWRKFDPAVQSTITNANAAITLMSQNPSVIKRPVIETGSKLLVGFEEAAYTNAFK